MEHRIVLEQLGPEIYQSLYEVDPSRPKIRLEGHEYKFNRSLFSRQRVHRKNNRITIHYIKASAIKEGKFHILPSYSCDYDYNVFRVTLEEVQQLVKQENRFEFDVEDSLMFGVGVEGNKSLPFIPSTFVSHIAIVITGPKHCNFAVRTTAEVKKYQPCHRLARSIVKTFPTVSEERNNSIIAHYRADRDLNKTDWEDQRKRFRKIVQMAFRARHN